jgi:HSP20 family protein
MTNEKHTHDAHELRAPDTEYVRPAVDIYETDKGHVLLADMPGVPRDGLDIHVENDRLTVRGRVAKAEHAQAQHREFVLRDYYRAFTLADEIDAEHINATLKNGVLRLVLPKSARAQVRKIPVTGG